MGDVSDVTIGLLDAISAAFKARGKPGRTRTELLALLARRREGEGTTGISLETIELDVARIGAAELLETPYRVRPFPMIVARAYVEAIAERSVANRTRRQTLEPTVEERELVDAGRRAFWSWWNLVRRELRDYAQTIEILARSPDGGDQEDAAKLRGGYDALLNGYEAARDGGSIRWLPVGDELRARRRALGELVGPVPRPPPETDPQEELAF